MEMLRSITFFSETAIISHSKEILSISIPISGRPKDPCMDSHEDRCSQEGRLAAAVEVTECACDAFAFL
jgi:hypothetical protein